jgi:hypothetical protein
VTNSQGVKMTGSNPSFTFWRLFGDFMGTGEINSTDLVTLTTAIGTDAKVNSSDWYLNYNGSNSLNGTDFAEFATRYGKSMETPSVVLK